MQQHSALTTFPICLSASLPLSLFQLSPTISGVVVPHSPLYSAHVAVSAVAFKFLQVIRLFNCKNIPVIRYSDRVLHLVSTENLKLCFGNFHNVQLRLACFIGHFVTRPKTHAHILIHICIDYTITFAVMLLNKK